MKLSTKTRYGLRFIAETSKFYGIRTVTLGEIAKNQNLSEKYLSQIVIPLRNAGLINSVRGNAGGYSLTRPPAEITVRSVFEALEGGTDLVDCTLTPEACPRKEDCSTEWVWSGLSEAITVYLDSLTLEDIRTRIMSGQPIDYSI